MFSTFGVCWVVTTTDDAAQSSQFLNDAPHMIRDRYVYKWLLVEHQRLCLLALNTECADMSKGIDGANFAETYRLVGSYAGKVLRRAKPADLPVVQPTRFELLINLNTAKALGLAIPQAILARADEVIE